MSELWKRNLPVPFFSQRENQYKWQRIADKDETIDGVYYNKGDVVGEPFSLVGYSCNITSLCMLLHYYGITDDTPDIMLEVFFT
jgi:hypothetical protein